MVATSDLKSGVERRTGSTPVTRTKQCFMCKHCNSDWTCGHKSTSRTTKHEYKTCGFQRSNFYVWSEYGWQIRWPAGSPDPFKRCGASGRFFKLKEFHKRFPIITDDKLPKVGGILKR